MHGGKRVSSLQRQAKLCTYFKPCFSDSLHLMFCVYMFNVVENPIHLPVLCLTPAEQGCGELFAIGLVKSKLTGVPNHSEKHFLAFQSKHCC